MTPSLEADGHDNELKNGLWVHVVVCPSGVRPVNGLRAPTPSAAVTKTSSPQTIGEEWPSPGGSIFHFRFSSRSIQQAGFRVVPLLFQRPPPLAPAHRIQRLAKRPPGNNDPIAAKRNAKDQGAMFRQKNIYAARMPSVGCIFNTLGQAHIPGFHRHANPYSFRT